MPYHAGRSFSYWFYPLALAAWVLAASVSQAIDWPQWLGKDRDGVWRETGLLTRFPSGGPRVLWRVPIGTGYSGPAVALGRVYVMDRERPTDASGKPVRPTRAGIPGRERTLCLRVADGKLLWKDEYDCPYTISYPSGPRTTPLVHEGRVYTLGAMGDLRCLDAVTGKLVWSRKLTKDYQLDSPPVWGFAGHPLLDGNLLYCLVGGPGSAVVAFHKDMGKEVWKALTTEEIGYSPPMIYEAGGKRQLFVWLSESINSLDPATGRLYWTERYPASGQPQRPAVNIATVRRLGDLLFLSTYYHGAMMLKLAADRPAATVLWKAKHENLAKPDSLHALMAAPVLKDGYIYGVCANGELRCLKADTGQQLWQTYAATCGKKTDCASAFLVPQGDRFVIFNDQGDLMLAELTPKGYREIDRAHILDPVQQARGRMVVWSHPAFAQQSVFARNDKEIVRLSLAAENGEPRTGQQRTEKRTRFSLLSVLCSLFTMQVAAGPPEGDATKKDLEKMQGDWAAASMVVDGTKLSDDEAQCLFRTVKGNHYSVYHFNREFGKGTFAIDASKKPKTIDATPASSSNKGKPLRGIYELEGDRLRVCFAPAGKERPTGFEAKQGSGHTMTVWEREKN